MSFRAYLQGLVLPRDQNKSLTGLAGTEPMVCEQFLLEFVAPVTKHACRVTDVPPAC